MHLHKWESKRWLFSSVFVLRASSFCFNLGPLKGKNVYVLVLYCTDFKCLSNLQVCKNTHIMHAPWLCYLGSNTIKLMIRAQCLNGCIISLILRGEGQSEHQLFIVNAVQQHAKYYSIRGSNKCTHSWDNKQCVLNSAVMKCIRQSIMHRRENSTAIKRFKGLTSMK